ncbi:hypothetical protein [Halothiobacillus sp.]|uniref:hypothetical protein n=1 Tax=Halothiobacillus sp. TaxID=1891311 RepID=UPI00260888C4|nr:hypothetical protein [Halothiobacillus sp.]MDD4967700.1 hypothetical protein [Halothiobacillus sp.]
MSSAIIRRIILGLAYSRMDAAREEIHGWAVHAEAAGCNPATSSRPFRAPFLLDTPNMTTAATELAYRIASDQTVGDTAPVFGLRAIERQIQRILHAPDEQPALFVFHDILPVTSYHLGTILEPLQHEGHSLRHFSA